MREEQKKVAIVLLCTAAMYIGSQIHIPFPGLLVPITLQTLFCILLPLVYGKMPASIGIGLFLIIGAFGIPVFAGHSGGMTHFAGNSGGYLFGFLVASLLTWNVKSQSRILRMAIVFGEFVVLQFLILTIGALWISFELPNWNTFFDPFVLPLLIKACLGSIILEALKGRSYRTQPAQHM